MRLKKVCRRLAGTALCLASGAALSIGTGCAPAVAHAGAAKGGSIVFVKRHNVWIMRGSGTHAHAVTHDGTPASPYVSPSESDRGIIVAGHGRLIVRMNQHGAVLSRIDPPALSNSAGEPMDGAVNDVALSPDGRIIAWSFVRYSCPIGADCLVRYATGYTASTKYRRVGRPTYYRAPSWIGNRRTLQTGGYGSQVMLQNTGATPRHWFDDSDMNFPSTDLADGEVSPDGRWLAEIRGYDASLRVAWYAVTGNAARGKPPVAPTYTCVTNADPKHASPTWSPDSSTVAWASTDGIYTQPGAASCGESAPARLLVKGGSAPDWSPAGLR